MLYKQLAEPTIDIHAWINTAISASAAFAVWWAHRASSSQSKQNSASRLIDELRRVSNSAISYYSNQSSDGERYQLMAALRRAVNDIAFAFSQSDVQPHLAKILDAYTDAVTDLDGSIQLPVVDSKALFFQIAEAEDKIVGYVLANSAGLEVK